MWQPCAEPRLMSSCTARCARSNTSTPSNQNSNLAMEAGFASNTLIPTFHIHQPFEIRIFRNMSVSLSPCCPETHPSLNHPALARANSTHLLPAKWHLTAPRRLNPLPRAAPAWGWWTSGLWWDMSMVQPSWEIYSWQTQQCRINHFILKGSLPSDQLPQSCSFAFSYHIFGVKSEGDYLLQDKKCILNSPDIVLLGSHLSCEHIYFNLFVIFIDPNERTN